MIRKTVEGAGVLGMLALSSVSTITLIPIAHSIQHLSFTSVRLSVWKTSLGWAVMELSQHGWTRLACLSQKNFRSLENKSPVSVTDPPTNLSMTIKRSTRRST